MPDPVDPEPTTDEPVEGESALAGPSVLPPPAAPKLGLADLTIGLGTLLVGVAYGLLHPLSQHVAAPIWFWIALPVLALIVSLTAARQGIPRVWFGFGVSLLLPLGLAIYDHARELEAIQILDDQALAMVALWQASADARGVLVIGAGVSLITAVGIELVLLRHQPRPPAPCGAQAWVALVAWAAALTFGRVQLEMTWLLEDTLAVVGIACLALLVRAGSSLSLAVWAPLVLVVLVWVRVDATVAIQNGIDALYEPGLEGGLERARRDRLVVLDAAASVSAVLLLLWSLRARLMELLRRRRRLVILAAGWVGLFAAERYINHAVAERDGLKRLIATEGRAAPSAPLRGYGWLPKAPVLVLRSSGSSWAEPPRYEEVPLTDQLTALSRRPAGLPMLPGPERTLVSPPPGVLVVAPRDLTLRALREQLGAAGESPLALLLRDARVTRKDDLALAASSRAVSVRFTGAVSALPKAEVPRYLVDIEGGVVVGPLGGEGTPPRLLRDAWRSFHCAATTAEGLADRACEVVVGAPSDWTLSQLMQPLAELLHPEDSPEAVMFLLTEDMAGVSQAVAP
ncbi:MAG: hypothetical protein KIT72_07360 [Polyangiaceae bacterium]|nr:hypothetical protein [Polyangiaceae bacterium]MCW5790221.1 hypothetical protein [Polyangiaceae bacterium]